VGATVNTAEGAVSAPFAGNSGVYLISPIAKREVDGFNNLAFYRRSGAAGMKRSAEGSLMKSLREAADIKDERSTYY